MHNTSKAKRDVKRLKKAIQKGVTDLRTGKVTDGAAVMDRLRKRVSQEDLSKSDR